MERNTMTVLRADGTETEEPAPARYGAGGSKFRDRLQEIIGGDIEFVWVEYKGERTCMIVNETGTLPGQDLPVNEAASIIYHTWPAKQKGVSMDLARDIFPLIYGDVAVLHSTVVD